MILIAIYRSPAKDIWSAGLGTLCLLWCSFLAFRYLADVGMSSKDFRGFLIMPLTLLQYLVPDDINWFKGSNTREWVSLVKSNGR